MAGFVVDENFFEYSIEIMLVENVSHYHKSFFVQSTTFSVKITRSKQQEATNTVNSSSNHVF
jgi:hypothetical protein